jgi:FtsZ-binding cell division protein ZapB
LFTEAPKIIQSFTDTIPDLQREIEKLTEKIGQTNDGFSSIIQNNEKLTQYAKGN